MLMVETALTVLFQLVQVLADLRELARNFNDILCGQARQGAGMLSCHGLTARCPECPYRSRILTRFFRTYSPILSIRRVVTLPP